MGGSGIVDGKETDKAREQDEDMEESFLPVDFTNKRISSRLKLRVATDVGYSDLRLEDASEVYDFEDIASRIFGNIHDIHDLEDVGYGTGTARDEVLRRRGLKGVE